MGLAVLYWSVVVCFAAAAAYATYLLPHTWRQSASGGGPPRAFPWDAVAYRGFRRAGPVGTVTSYFLVVAAALVGPDDHPALGGVASAVLSISGVALVVGGSVSMGIYFYARPKVLIPPGLRGEVGARAERRHAHRG